MILSDSGPGLTENCGLSSSRALEMMQPLHALIDQEIEKSRHLITGKHLALCETNCHCGIYSDIAENKQLKNDLYKKAEVFPKKRLVECAQKTAQWICSDPLLESLKSELNAQ